MTEALTNAIKSKRSFRISLRSSAILVTAMSGLLAYWAAGARSNRVAIESVLRRGGQVEFWHNVVDTDPQYFSVTSLDPSIPAWLRKSLGDEWFVSVVGVSLGKGSSDEDVSRLLGLSRLWLIDGDLSSLTDDGVRSLARLVSLRRLRLNDNRRITDDGVRSLATLTNLWELELECTNISSRGLRDMRISGMRQLRTIRVSETKVDDTGVALLAGLPELRHLRLDRTSVSDDSIEHFGHMEMLQDLSLYDTRVSPEGVARLRKLRPSLRVSGPR